MILICAGILNIISARYAQSNAENNLKNPYIALPDIIHHYTPKIHHLVPDLFLLCCFILLILNYPKIHHVNAILLCVSWCFIIRSLTMHMTIMPTCMKKTKSNTIYEKLFISTHDLMFSGHTIFFLAIAGMLKNIWIAIIGSLLLIIARQHYTIDVFVSWVVYGYIYHGFIIYM